MIPLRGHLNNVSGEIDIDSLPPDILNILLQKHNFEKLFKAYEKKVKAEELNDNRIDELILQWLEGYESKETQRSYKRNLRLFLEWLKGKSKGLLDVNANLVDAYIVYLKRKSISANTFRLRIGACSSFWTALIRWETIEQENPFIGVRGLPKKPKKIKKAEEIPSDNDLDFLEKYAFNQMKATGKGSTGKIRSAIKALCAVKVMRATGLRIGALKNMEIDRNGYYTAKTKGGIATGFLDEEVLNVLRFFKLPRKKPLEKFNESTFRSWLSKVMNSDQWKTEIGNTFSAHGIRHRFAIKLYIESGFDIALVSARLGHGDIQVTTEYLAGLKTEWEQYKIQAQTTVNH